MSRFVIDAHVHPQRFAPSFLKRGERFTYDKLEDAIMSELLFDNSRALLADMDRLGSDWGASISYHYYGEGTTIYASTPPTEPPTELPLHIDWNLRQVMGLEISEEDRAKILGLNTARLCKLDTAELQKQKEDRYGEQISWDEVSLRWSSKDGEQPAPTGGKRAESEGQFNNG